MPVPKLFNLAKKEIKQIYIGVDFGTAYTKVSYSYAPTENQQIHTIKWDNSFFKSTILYLKDDHLFYEAPEKEYREIRYFKYSIIETKLKNSSYKTINNFEQMCCVFFLAQILKRTVMQIQKQLDIPDVNLIDISINMGVPLENFYDIKEKNNKGLYQDILEDAIVLAGGSKIPVELPENQVLISNFDNVYSEILNKKAKLRWKANVYPELASELLLYHQSKFVPDGVYAIIDIGGGTVDMALFQKITSIETKNTYMYCLSQKVLSLGIEILKTLDKEVATKSLKNAFGEMMKKSKNYVDVHYDKYTKVPVFFLGGGASDPYYINIIKSLETPLQNAGIPPLEYSSSLEDYINNEKMLIQKNQRLIISQMLSKHSEDIIKVQGFPDFYEENNGRSPTVTFDLEEYLREKGDMYRD